MYQAHEKPCFGCPYRKDCPSGVWAKEEYQKLDDYDKETGNQPFEIFLCHDGDRTKTLCRGWLDTHDKQNLISLRLAISMEHVSPDIMNLPLSSVPVYASGKEAMEHGMMDLKHPSVVALELQRKLVRRHPELLPDEDEDEDW